MKKKFDIDKFLKYFKDGNNTGRSLLLSDQEELDGPFKTKENDEYFLFTKHNSIEADFTKLDKSFKYSPILTIKDTPDPDDGLYFYDCEYGLLSSSKTRYSFLTKFSDYNINCELICFETFENTNSQTKVNLSSYVLADIDKSKHFCKSIFLNNKYKWGSEKEYTELKGGNKFPKSILESFMPLYRNKKIFAKECGASKSEIKEITSSIIIMSEEKIKKRQNIKTWSELKGEASYYINE
jgi:hypothetical protein